MPPATYHTWRINVTNPFGVIISHDGNAIAPLLPAIVVQAAYFTVSPNRQVEFAVPAVKSTDVPSPVIVSIPQAS